MRHLNRGRKLNRTSAHRKALFKTLVLALIRHGRIRTTDAKAKELKRWGDRLITLGKDGTLHARRRAAALIPSATVVRKLFTELGPRYAGRNGGYTRVVKLGVRVGDAAPLSVVELVDRGGAAEAEQAPKKKPARRRKTAEAAATDQPKKKPATRRRAAAG